MPVPSHGYTSPGRGGTRRASGEIPRHVGRRRWRALEREPRVARAQPRRAWAGRTGRTPPFEGISADQFCASPLGARPALPKPGHPRLRGVRLRGSCRSDHPKFPPGEREASRRLRYRARLFRGAQHRPKPRTNFACAAALGWSPLLAGCEFPSEDVSGDLRPGPRGPHLRGALASARHVRTLGASHRDRGARQRRTLAVYKPARHLRFCPFSDHFWSPVWK